MNSHLNLKEDDVIVLGDNGFYIINRKTFTKNQNRKKAIANFKMAIRTAKRAEAEAKDEDDFNGYW